uniref:C-type lectin domain-containing protein n=1 Tax=Sinocyclocheilus rhinocerous TaxID=307959 RepID=A0A673N4G8_9TELE
IMTMLRSLLLLFIVISMGNADGNQDIYLYKPSLYAILKGCSFFFQSVNWITAERNCLGLDANLASVHNKLENDLLLSLLPSSSTLCWLGVHDGEQEGQWMWSDGTPYDYTYWCSYEPNNRNVENCGEVNFSSNRCWNDIACSTSMGYICAIDL